MMVSPTQVLIVSTLAEAHTEVSNALKHCLVAKIMLYFLHHNDVGSQAHLSDIQGPSMCLPQTLYPILARPEP